jgi:hypothetical protein
MPYKEILEVAVNIAENARIIGNDEDSRLSGEYVLGATDDCSNGSDGKGLGR